MKVSGGNGEMKILQSFLALVILGYFGIKIIYGGFFQFYPDKYYYRSVDIQTSEKDDMDNTKKIALNSFMPGIWNSEMTDFVSCIILIGIVYVFTNISSRQMFQGGGYVAPSVIIGYLIGLGFPVFYQSVRNCRFDTIDKCSQQNYGILGITAFIILILLGLNARYPTENKMSYFIYACSILLLIVGLLITKKLSKTYQQVTYYKNQDDKCTYKQTGYLFSSGDQILITPAFASWVLLFFFTIEPQQNSVRQFIYFLFGFLLGIFVSSMSYFGIDYFLVKLGEKSCNSVDECYLKDMPRPPADVKTTDTDFSTVTSEEGEVMVKGPVDVPKNMMIMKTVMIVFIVLMMIYFIYLAIAKKK